MLSVNNLLMASNRKCVHSLQVPAMSGVHLGDQHRLLIGPMGDHAEEGHSMGVSLFCCCFPCSEPVESEAVLEALGKVVEGG